MSNKIENNETPRTERAWLQTPGAHDVKIGCNLCAHPHRTYPGAADLYLITRKGRDYLACLAHYYSHIGYRKSEIKDAIEDYKAFGGF